MLLHNIFADVGSMATGSDKREIRYLMVVVTHGARDPLPVLRTDTGFQLQIPAVDSVGLEEDRPDTIRE